MSEDKKGTGTVCGSTLITNSENEQPGPGHCEDLFARFVERSTDGILLTGESGSLVVWNTAMEQITGLPYSEVRGKKLWEVYLRLIPEDKRNPGFSEHLKSLLISALETGKSAELEQGIEHEIQRPDKQLRIIESRMFTIPAGNAFMLGALLRDITGRKRSELAVQEANRKLLLSSSITRHDINNQLTIFGGYLSLLEAGTPDIKIGDIIRILEAASGKIQRILKFTKEYGEVGAKPPLWQDLGETIRLAKTMVEIDTVRFLPGEACNGVKIYADPQLVRVFSNLIDNSLRHGEKVSEIEIHCKREEHRLVIVYRDNGIGISNAVRPVLFERGKGKNTGYGTFLVREILAITGLTITETGVAGEGARFEIVVPEGSFRIEDKKLQP